MGLLDFLTGNADPDPTVPRLSRDELYAGLLAMRNRQAGWHVRAGGGEDGADLVVEWGPVDLDFRGAFGASGWRTGKRMLLRLVDVDSMVRSIDEDGVFRWDIDTSSARFEVSGGRGQSWTMGGQLTFGNVDGTPDHVASRSFDTDAMKRPIRNAVAQSGWGWHGVAFGAL